MHLQGCIIGFLSQSSTPDSREGGRGEEQLPSASIKVAARAAGGGENRGNGSQLGQRAALKWLMVIWNSGAAHLLVTVLNSFPKIREAPSELGGASHHLTHLFIYFSHV